MREILLRKSRLFDHQAIVAINDAEVGHTSPMDIRRLRELDHYSAYHKVAETEGIVAGFLLAIRDGSLYKNENYEWFSLRYPRFLYVDRIVVNAKFTGMKIGTMLYRDIFEYARSNDIPVIACEFNVKPPNEPSRAFHEKFGFCEVGKQWLAGGNKRVSMQAARVES